MTRSHTRLVFWLVVFLLVYTGMVWTVDDTCVSSSFIEQGQPQVINPTVCE